MLRISTRCGAETTYQVIRLSNLNASLVSAQNRKCEWKKPTYRAVCINSPLMPPMVAFWVSNNDLRHPVHISFRSRRSSSAHRTYSSKSKMSSALTFNSSATAFISREWCLVAKAGKTGVSAVALPSAAPSFAVESDEAAGVLSCLSTRPRTG